MTQSVFVALIPCQAYLKRACIHEIFFPKSFLSSILVSGIFIFANAAEATKRVFSKEDALPLTQPSEKISEEIVYDVQTIKVATDYTVDFKEFFQEGNNKIIGYKLNIPEEKALKVLSMLPENIEVLDVFLNAGGGEGRGIPLGQDKPKDLLLCQFKHLGFPKSVLNRIYYCYQIHNCPMLSPTVETLDLTDGKVNLDGKKGYSDSSSDWWDINDDIPNLNEEFEKS